MRETAGAVIENKLNDDQRTPPVRGRQMDSFI